MNEQYIPVKLVSMLSSVQQDTQGMFGLQGLFNITNMHMQWFHARNKTQMLSIQIEAKSVFGCSIFIGAAVAYMSPADSLTYLFYLLHLALQCGPQQADHLLECFLVLWIQTKVADIVVPVKVSSSLSYKVRRIHLDSLTPQYSMHYMDDCI